MGQTKMKGKSLAIGGGEERDGDVFTILGEGGAVTVIDGARASHTNLPFQRMGDNLCLHDIRLHILPHV